jgi:hypothetical protein
MTTKAIATPPGQATNHVTLTQAEEDELTAKNSTWDAEADDRESAKERKWRDAELRNCDWTQLPDAPFTGPQKTNWSTYRQELRDMPTLIGFPNTHTRPTRPAGE